MELIVAIDQHWVIGPIGWNVPEDMAHFRRVTAGHIVIMGRKTFDSLKAPLSDRINIVLTRSFDCRNISDNAQVIYTGLDGLFCAIDRVKTISNKVFVIGGAETYRLLFPYVTVVHLTLIGHGGPVGDIVLPDEIMAQISDAAAFTMTDGGDTRDSRIRPNKYEFMRFERKTIRSDPSPEIISGRPN